MKIKKTYTHARVGLLVGLLSFHTLYSCVHTGRQLGMNDNLNGQNEQLNKLSGLKQNYACTMQKMKKYNLKDPWYKSRYFASSVVVGMVVGGMVVGYLVYNNMLFPATPIENTLTNAMLPGGNATTVLASNLVPVQSMVNTTIGAMGTTVKDVVTTAGTVGIAALNTTGIIAALKPNGSNVHDNSSKVTTTTPITPTDRDANTIPEGCKLFDSTDRYSLTDKMIAYATEDSFSKETIECLFVHNHLHPDATDRNNSTALMASSKFNQPESAMLLDKLGADPNLTNKDGDIAMAFANFSNPAGRKIANYIGSKKNIDLCIKNKKGQSVKDKRDVKLLKKNVQAKINTCP